LDLLNFLKKNVISATGCTEPIAIAYAVSLAYYALFQEKITSDINNSFKFFHEVPEIKPESIEMINIKVDQNIYKNAYAAIIPGTNGLKGIEIAAALALYQNPKAKLNIFKNLNLVNFDKIEQILNKEVIKISYTEDRPTNSSIKIDVSLKYRSYEDVKTSKVKIRETHDNVVEIKVNGMDLYKKNANQISDKKIFDSLNLKKTLEIVETASNAVLDEVNKGILLNVKVANEGLARRYGIGIAKNLRHVFNEDGCSNSIISEIRCKVASAADARMGGTTLPVMTTSGSGNMGITAIIPVVIMGERRHISETKIKKAVLLSHLITSIADQYLGHLSALCGTALKSGFGVAAAITYLLDGSQAQIHNAINLLAANNIGFLCDGAKPSCALKVSTAAGVATECALLALNNQKVNHENGIIFENPDDSLKGIGRLCHSIYPINKEIIELIKKSSEN
jgi:L-cysteine desulfidase